MGELISIKMAGAGEGFGAVRALERGRRNACVIEGVTATGEEINLGRIRGSCVGKMGLKLVLASAEMSK